jgi:hypothetical protein
MALVPLFVMLLLALYRVATNLGETITTLSDVVFFPLTGGTQKAIPYRDS